MRVLFVTTVLPHGRRSGGEVVSNLIVKTAERLGHRVRVLGYRAPDDGGAVPDGYMAVGRRHIETRDSGWHKYLWLAKAATSRRAYSVAKFISSRYREALCTSMREWKPDLVVIDHVQMGWVLNLLPRSLPAILCAHNVEHHVYARAAQTTRGAVGHILLREARMMQRLECAAAERVVEVWALTHEDAECFAGNSIGVRTRVLTIPSQGRGRVDDDGEATHKAIDLALMGTWTWQPNRAGLDWFLTSVLPLLSKDLKVAVAGRGAEFLSREYPGIRYLGFVPDPDTFLAGARVVVIPSVSGSGIQIRTIEGAGAGHVLAVTPVATRGIDHLPDNVFLGDSAEGLAHAIEEALAVPDPGRCRRAGQDWDAKRRRLFEHALQLALDNARAHCGTPRPNAFCISALN